MMDMTAAHSRHDAQTESPLVFVIDDDPSARQALETLVRSAGWLTSDLGYSIADLFSKGVVSIGASSNPNALGRA